MRVEMRRGMGLKRTFERLADLPFLLIQLPLLALQALAVQVLFAQPRISAYDSHPAHGLVGISRVNFGSRCSFVASYNECKYGRGSREGAQ
jgi:hypothetical protein